MTADWMNRVQESSKFKQGTAIKEQVYFYIRAAVSLPQIKHLYAFIYVQDTKEMKKAAIKEREVFFTIHATVFR